MESGLVSLMSWARDPGYAMVINARAKIEGDWVKIGKQRGVILSHLPLYFSKNPHVVEGDMSAVLKKKD